MDNNVKSINNISYSSHLLTWLSVITLIVISVVLARFDLGISGLVISLVLAFLESVIIIKNFMHINFTELIFKVYLILGVISLIILMYLLY